MKSIEKGGNPMRNAGLLLLLLNMFLCSISAMIYVFQNNELWFSRAALASILLGLYLIADKDS